jgi:hypothetical protein
MPRPRPTIERLQILAFMPRQNTGCATLIMKGFGPRVDVEERTGGIFRRGWLP